MKLSASIKKQCLIIWLGRLNRGGLLRASKGVLAICFQFFPRSQCELYYVFLKLESLHAGIKPKKKSTGIKTSIKMN
jgi:hypothetical protein